VSSAQAEIIQRALRQPGGICSVDGEVRSARVLANLGLGELQDDCPEDGGAWIFQLADGVTLR